MEKVTISFDEAQQMNKDAHELLAQAYQLFKNSRDAKEAENEKIIQFVMDNTYSKAPMCASALLNCFEGINSQKLVGRMMYDKRIKHKEVTERRKFVEVDDNGKPLDIGGVIYSTQTHNVYWG